MLIPPNTSTYKFNPSVLGVRRIDFCDNSMFFSTTSVGIMQNMLGISSIQVAAGGAGRLDSFLHWRRTFQRVSNQRAEWVFQPSTQRALIYNPASFTVCAIVFRPRTFDTVELNHKDWLKNMVLAKATVQLGMARNKFGGTIQGPGGSVITLDSKDLLSRGEDEVKKQEDHLMTGIQSRAVMTWD